MNASQLSYRPFEDREVPFLVGFECFLEYVPPNKRFVDFIDQFLSLGRVSGSVGRMSGARIVTIRLARVDELLLALNRVGGLQRGVSISFSKLVEMARAKSAPGLIHDQAYDCVESILSMMDVSIEPGQWQELIHIPVAEVSMEQSSSDASNEYADLPTLTLESIAPPPPLPPPSQPSIPVAVERSSQSSIKAPPHPVRRHQPSRP